MRLVYLCSLVAVLLASCSFHINNWQGTTVPGKEKASFSYFNSKNSNAVTLEKDQLLFVDYAVNVVKGSLTVSVTRQKRALWRKQFTQNDTARFYLTSPEAGTYAINITGDHAEGGFDINYTGTAPKKVSVRTSKNIELYGLMMHLDDVPDILKHKDTLVFDGRRATASQWYTLPVKNYFQYKPYDTCQIMSIYRKMEADGYFYDFFVGFLLQVDEAPNAKITAFTDAAVVHGFSKKGDSVEARRNAEAFLAAFNDFYRAVNFDAYLAGNKAYYDLANANVVKNLPPGDMLPVMEDYYRKKFNHYYLVPSLNILTGMGFGQTNRKTGTIYNSFGPFSFQNFESGHLDMGFDYPEKIKGLAVHEFGHSFANPAIAALPQSLIDSTARLYEPIKKQMSTQAYTSWTMSLNEHLVRTGEVIVAEKLGDSARAVTIMRENVDKGFIYLPFLVKELKAWDKNPAGVSFNDAVLHSLRKLSTGLPIADLMDSKLTVTRAMARATNPAPANTVQPIETLYAKPSSHLLIP